MKKGLENKYHLLAVHEGFDPNTDFSQQVNGLSVLLGDWDFYESIVKNPQEKSCYLQETDDCDSEVEMEQGTEEL